MAKNTVSALDAAIAAANLVTAPVKTAPVVDTTTTVKAGAVSSESTVLTVDGYTLVVTGGTFSESVKANVTRGTTNPWYPVIEHLSARAACYITITRPEGSTAKSPVSQIKSAIARALFADVKNAGKMTVKSGTDKGVWYLVRRP